MDPSKSFSPGKIVVISKSGGMCSEISKLLTEKGFGQKYVVGIGGEYLIGMDYVDILKEIKDDPEIEGIVVYGEVGGLYEHYLADYLKEHPLEIPVIAFITGRCVSLFPQGASYGHAGTIIEGEKTTAQAKTEYLKDSACYTVKVLEEIPQVLGEIIGNKNK